MDTISDSRKDSARTVCPSMELTHEDIAEIIKLIDDSTLDELVLEVGGVRIEARRKGAMVSSPPPSVVAAPAPSPPPAPASPPAAPVSSASPGASAVTVGPGQVAVTAPMVGTFYRRSSPETPPFVEVGSRGERRGCTVPGRGDEALHHGVGGTGRNRGRSLRRRREPG